MVWPGRASRASAAHSSSVPDAIGGEPVERAAPGIAALFEPLTPDGHSALMDLGPAKDRHLRIFSAYARQVRFAGPVPRNPTTDEWRSVLRSLRPNPDRPYDVMLAWDVLDRLDAAHRASLIVRLAEVTLPGARLYTVFDSSGAPRARSARPTLIDIGRVREEPTGPPLPARDPILPAQVERMLSPFAVVHAFTLRSGRREYVAVRR